MKHFFLLFVAMAVLITACNNEKSDDNEMTGDMVNNPNDSEPGDEDGTPVISFEVMEYDFGTIKQGEKIEYNFKFTNTGDADLIITDAKSTCGCTIPSYPQRPIKPGESSVIPVQYNSTGKRNNIKKPVIVTANTVPNETTVYIKGFVEVDE